MPSYSVTLMLVCLNFFFFVVSRDCAVIFVHHLGKRTLNITTPHYNVCMCAYIEYEDVSPPRERERDSREYVVLTLHHNDICLRT